MNTCPVCAGGKLITDRLFPVVMAAQHFAPRRANPQLHHLLQIKLQKLWNTEQPVLRRCVDCRFGFPVPYVAGDPEFYNLASGGNQHYPAWRWEFGLTLKELPAGQILLECGAGDGMFLRHVSGYRRIALEYNQGALAKLRALGVEALAQNVTDFHGHADVICIFQTMEHLAPVEPVFTAFRRILAPRGDLFMSLPNGDAIDAQERLTGLLDMPPNHVGRWYPETIYAAARRFGFDLVRFEVNKPRRLGTAWLYAQYRSRSRALTSDGVDALIGGVQFRLLRGLLRRGRALVDLPPLAFEVTPGPDLWAHLRAR